MANNLYEYYKSKGQELPNVASRKPVAEKAGITDYTGTKTQNESLLGYLQNTPSMDSTITPDKLTTETPIKTTQPKDFSSSVNKGINNLLTTTNERIKTEEATAKTEADATAKLIESQGDINKEDIYDKNKVNEKKALVNTVSNKINQENADLITAIEEAQKNPEGLSAGALQAKINDIRTQSARRSARYGIELSATTNDYQQAYDIAKTQIDDITNNLKYQIEAKKFILEQAGTKLATDKANAFTLQVKALDNESDLLKDAVKTATDGIKNGTIDKESGYSALQELITGETSLSDFYNKLGVDVGTDATGENIAGYDITSYATDPLHEQKVLSIYSSIPVISDTKSAQNVIDRLSPNSPITGEMVMSSSKRYGVDPSLMIAIMQQDSSLGTAGLGAKTKNAGNVGNDDAGNTVTFDSWGKGVDAVGKWLSNHKATEKVSYKEYGLLSNTSFNPENSTDKSAKAYIDYYLKNATFPTSYALGMGRSTSSMEKFSNASSRANDLYFEATGSSLPDVNVLKGNKALIVANNKILNNQAILGETIVKNFDLAIDGEITNNVNKNATIVNRILNPIYLALGDPAVNQALVSNGTITQEFANLISIRNASGTTVADKEMADELIKFGTSVEAQKAVVERLKAEASNIHNALKNQNKELYKTIDPLQQSPENPNRANPDEAKLTDYFTQLGMKDAGNNTILIPRTQWSKLTATHDEVGGQSRADALLKTLKDKGYTLLVQ